MDVQVKADLKKKFGKHEKDTGSVEVQVALLSQRIKELTEHCKIHKKDNHSRRGLTLMVSQRRRLLNYLSAKDKPRYQAVVQQLGLRK